jgi:hypothetical protein
MNPYPRCESSDCRSSMEIRLDLGGSQVNSQGQYGNQRLCQDEIAAWQQGC